MVYELEFRIGNTRCILASVQPFNTPEKKEGKYYEHYHPCFEIHYIEEGASTFLCNKKHLTVSKNQMLLIPPRIYHKEITSNDESVKMTISVDISPCTDSVGDNHFHSVFPKDIALVLTASAALKATFLKIKKLASVSETSHTAREKLRAYTHLLMAELYDELSSNSPIGTTLSKDSTLSREFEIDTHLALNFTSNSAKDALAKKLHVSPRQLHRIMMKSYGKGYREKLRETRLEIALSFLTSTSKSITDISEEMGYSSVESFSAFIKRETGKSPRQIRKSIE